MNADKILDILIVSIWLIVTILQLLLFYRKFKLNEPPTIVTVTASGTSFISIIVVFAMLYFYKGYTPTIYDYFYVLLVGTYFIFFELRFYFSKQNKVMEEERQWMKSVNLKYRR